MLRRGSGGHGPGLADARPNRGRQVAHRGPPPRVHRGVGALDPFDPRAVGAAYDAVADDYENAFAGDLERLPVDTAVIRGAAERSPTGLPVLDVGCGPGQVAALLADCGSTVIGVDLALAMLAVARRRTPSLPLTSADMRALPVRDRCCGGVVAYYSVQHVARADLDGVLDEFRRVVIPGGLLVIATHLGEGEVVVEEFLGHTIEPVGGTFYERTELERAIASAGFAIEDVRERDALEHEYPSRRVYLTARAVTSPPGRRPVL